MALGVDGETINLYWENRALGTTKRLSGNCDGAQFSLFCMKLFNWVSKYTVTFRFLNEALTND